MPTVAPISVTVAGPSRSRNRSSDGSINITDEPNTARVRVGDRRRYDAPEGPPNRARSRRGLYSQAEAIRVPAVGRDRGMAVRELLGLEHGDGVAVGVLEPG
jgi:hypothetical protein